MRRALRAPVEAPAADVEAVRGVSVAEERLLMRQMQLLRW